MEGVKDLQKWLNKHILHLTNKYEKEASIEKKIHIGARLKAFKDVLNVVANQLKESEPK